MKCIHDMPDMCFKLFPKLFFFTLCTCCASKVTFEPLKYLSKCRNIGFLGNNFTLNSLWTLFMLYDFLYFWKDNRWSHVFRHYWVLIRRLSHTHTHTHTHTRCSRVYLGGNVILCETRTNSVIYNVSRVTYRLG